MKALNKTATEIAIAYLIAKLCKRINVVRNMTADQISECAKTIVTDYWTLTYDDIALALDMGYKNQLGDDRLAIFDRMDESIILRWLLAYDVIRTQKLRDKEDQVNVYQVVASDPVYAIVKELADKKSSVQILPPAQPIKQQPMTIDKIIHHEFEQLLKTNRVGELNVVNYNGQQLDLIGYFNIRFDELLKELDEKM
jgi:hypothetical protein